MSQNTPGICQERYLDFRAHVTILSVAEKLPRREGVEVRLVFRVIKIAVELDSGHTSGSPLIDSAVNLQNEYPD